MGFDDTGLGAAMAESNARDRLSKIERRVEVLEGQLRLAVSQMELMLKVLERLANNAKS